MFHLSLEFWGWFSLLIAVVSYAPYLRSVVIGKTKPHAFSWFIWSLLTAIAFFAQIVGKAGPGALVTGLTAVTCGVIAVLALSKGEKEITRSDWATFIVAVAALPIWWVSADPLYSVILITLIEALGF